MIWMGLSIELWLFIMMVVLCTVLNILWSGKVGKLKSKLTEYDSLKRKFNMSKPAMSYDECKEIIDICTSEAIMELELRYEINDVKYIKNIEEDTIAITKEIMMSVSMNVFLQMECYISKSHIIKYISRNVKLSLMAYMDRKK